VFRIAVALTVAAFAAPASAQVQVPLPGSFLGGVPAGAATDQTLQLSMTGAIGRALEHNLGVLTSSDRVDVARGSRLRALSELLPNVSAHVGETRQQINLQAFGLTVPGLPTIVGPFNVFDARVYVTQSVLDFKTINDARAESHRLAAERLSYKSARDLVVLATANGYLQVLAAHARADSANAQRETAQALFNQAVDLRREGLTAGIDVVRAEVQLATERQRATAATNDLEKAKLQLARAIGLPVGQAFSTTDDLPYRPAPDVTIEQALDRAARTRPDYQAAIEQVRAAEASRRAALGEALPSLHVNADYGTIGLTAPGSRGTFSVAALASIPIFQGGRAQGRLIETDAELRSRRAEAEDLKAGVYYDVRTAFLDLQATGEQLQVATRARELAASQLSQARDRFAAGVADNIEVVQAQEAVALASEQYIGALYGFNFSKASLAHAMGVAETAIRDYLGGVLE
jgi:outer membrane protein TolC